MSRQVRKNGATHARTGDEPARPLDCPKCGARVEAEVADLYGGECPACGWNLAKPFKRADEPAETPTTVPDRLVGPMVAPIPKPAPVATPAAKKPQVGRLIKVACNSCGWTLRTTRQWIARGMPVVCCCGGSFEMAA